MRLFDISFKHLIFASYYVPNLVHAAMTSFLLPLPPLLHWLHGLWCVVPASMTLVKHFHTVALNYDAAVNMHVVHLVSVCMCVVRPSEIL